MVQPSKTSWHGQNPNALNREAHAGFFDRWPNPTSWIQGWDRERAPVTKPGTLNLLLRSLCFSCRANHLRVQRPLPLRMRLKTGPCEIIRALSANGSPAHSLFSPGSRVAESAGGPVSDCSERTDVRLRRGERSPPPCCSPQSPERTGGTTDG